MTPKEEELTPSKRSILTDSCRFNPKRMISISPVHLSAVTPIDQPEKTGGTIPKHEAIVSLDTPPVVVSSSKPLTRQDVRHSKGVNLEDSDRVCLRFAISPKSRLRTIFGQLTTRQMSSGPIKAKAGVSKPMVAP